MSFSQTQVRGVCSFQLQNDRRLSLHQPPDGELLRPPDHVHRRPPQEQRHRPFLCPLPLGDDGSGLRHVRRGRRGGAFRRAMRASHITMSGGDSSITLCRVTFKRHYEVSASLGPQPCCCCYYCFYS